MPRPFRGMDRCVEHPGFRRSARASLTVHTADELNSLLPAGRVALAGSRCSIVGPEYSGCGPDV